MSHRFTCRVRLEAEGVPLEGFPLITDVETAEMQGFEYRIPSEATYRSVPAEAVEALEVLAIQPDAPADVRLMGQSVSVVPIAKGGLLLIAGGHVCAKPATNATLRQQSGALAFVRGIAAGGPEQ